jgi:desulfoferrodoxin (superoxide reductase-like protein)
MAKKEAIVRIVFLCRGINALLFDFVQLVSSLWRRLAKINWMKERVCLIKDTQQASFHKERGNIQVVEKREAFLCLVCVGWLFISTDDILWHIWLMTGEEMKLSISVILWWLDFPSYFYSLDSSSPPQLTHSPVELISGITYLVFLPQVDFPEDRMHRFGQIERLLRMMKSLKWKLSLLLLHVLKSLVIFYPQLKTSQHYISQIQLCRNLWECDTLRAPRETLEIWLTGVRKCDLWQQNPPRGPKQLNLDITSHIMVQVYCNIFGVFENTIFHWMVDNWLSWVYFAIRREIDSRFWKHLWERKRSIS